MIKIEDLTPQFKRVSVLLKGPCNYRCYYCYVDRSRLERAPFGRFSTAKGAGKLVAMLDTMGMCSVCLVGAGEVMLLPNFIKLCSGIIQRHYLGITTNFSRPIEPFIEAVPPAKVSSFAVSLHPEAEEYLASFKKKALKMKKAGYPITVIYVAHPLRIKNIPGLYDFFTKNDVVFKVAPFNGKFRDRIYPASYKQSDIDFLRPYIVDPLSQYSLSRRTRCHTGKFCASGFSSFAIFEEDGRIQRCQDSPDIYGNVFKGVFKPLPGPSPCTSLVCHCDVCLEEQVFLRHYYDKFSTKKLPPVSKATMEEYEKICSPLNNFIPVTNCRV